MARDILALMKWKRGQVSILASSTCARGYILAHCVVLWAVIVGEIFHPFATNVQKYVYRNHTPAIFCTLVSYLPCLPAYGCTSACH
ncbi:hypothetical protein QR685DRAFT_70309 [Neurospora intermedia]|uniref:Uncharacterized protein n=1 Tax=Neurospora intermedia TaxID=5142 RepID=A0ABR3DTX5_NEUIN